MATTLNSCADSDIISFPLRTSITDIQSYYSTLGNTVPNVVPTFTPRTSNPNFKDDTRSSGEIDEPQNAIQVRYNDNSYQLVNAQITLPTHSDWIVNENPSVPIQNKIDYIVTLENMQDKIPRFVIIVLPIIIDDNTTVNNTYLQGLAYLSSDISYSLSSLYTGLDDYFYYITCLAPHGDKAFVYVNRDGLRINSDLYNNLLATWTQQSLSSVQNRILDNLTPTQKALSRLFQNVKNATNLQEIQQQINNIQATAQTPVINSMVETWPRYSPPYDIVLNVPSRTITAPAQSNSDEEGFRNRLEGFKPNKRVFNYSTLNSEGFLDINQYMGTCSGSNCFTSAALSNILTQDDIEDEQDERRILNSTKCVPLDIDNSVDSSGNIIFEEGVPIDNIELKRRKLREEYDKKQLTYENLISYTSPFFACIVAIGFFYSLWPFIKRTFLNDGTMPISQSLPKFESKIENVGFYIIFSGIILFAGFLIGAVVSRAY